MHARVECAAFRIYLLFPGLLGSGLTILFVSSVLNIFMRSYFLYQVGETCSAVEDDTLTV